MCERVLGCGRVCKGVLGCVRGFVEGGCYGVKWCIRVCVTGCMFDGMLGYYVRESVCVPDGLEQ